MIEAHYLWSKAPVYYTLQDLMRNLYLQRGIDSNQKVLAFNKPAWSLIHSPWQLHDMDKAVKRIRQAIHNQEQITIYGDYDVDGMTSTSLMYETLKQLGAKVNYYIPSRERDGYGPKWHVYQRMISHGTQLVVTVDNGVSGKDVIDKAVGCGIDVVITDHHTLPEHLPTKACAIVHPSYPGSHYPFKGLSGVGVAFKVAWALLSKPPYWKMDLVALGEIADVMPVNDENRALIYDGLKILEKTKRPGLRELLKIAKLNDHPINSTDAGFQICPRLNSLGRIADGKLGVELLTCMDPVKGAQLARESDELNTKRKGLVAQVDDEVKSQVANNANQALIILGHDWPRGVLGIVANDIMDSTGKPTLVLSQYGTNQEAKGSGRSREGFNVYAALDPHRDLMVSFGGHPQACGLAVEVDKLDELQKVFNQEALKQGFNASNKPALKIDAQVTPNLLGQIKTYQLVNRLQPFGPKNRQPMFLLKNVAGYNYRQMGNNHQHFKFQIGDLTCVDFNVDPMLFDQIVGHHLDIVGNLSLNYWRGKKIVQLIIKDLRTID